jgi:hypothetical protein
VNQDRDGEVEYEESVIFADYQLPEVDRKVDFEFAVNSGKEKAYFAK